MTDQLGKGRQHITTDRRGMAQAQARTGCRGPAGESYPSDHHDPTGEAAYQKAFAEAAKMKPPRVPNAAFYTNSPSAQEAIRRRNQELFPARSQVKRETKPNPSYEPPQPDIHRLARNALSGNAQTNHHSQSSSTSSNGSGGRHSAQQYTDPQSNGAQPPPLLMEPKFGPAGPDRKIR